MKLALTTIAFVLAAAGMAYADPPGDQTPVPPKPNLVCLNPGDIDHLSYPDDNTILFYMKSGKVRIWRNDLKRACSGLKFEQGIAYEIRGGTICSNMQVVYVMRRWIPCMLGAFTPYTPPPKDAPAPAVAPPK